MRSLQSLLYPLLATLMACSPAAATAQTRVTVRHSSGGSGGSGGSDSWLNGSALQTRIVVGADGETYVAVWLDAPNQAQGIRTRAPMALSLVVDTSGSMGGEKIERARMAAASLLETLVDGDIVSIYAFSNRVQEIAPPTVVSRATRPSLMARAQGLYASGGTNLYGGVQTGIERVASAPPTHTVRRVVLISDGHANVGPSDSQSLGVLASNGTEYGVQISGIGVGLDYDENTLGTLAVRSSGRLYHLQHPAQMASIIEQEVQLLSQTIATGAFIEITPAPGVRIIEGISTGAAVQNGRLRMPLGSIFAGQHREVLFRAQVDTSRQGDRALVAAQLVYNRPGEIAQQRQEAALRYEVIRDSAAAQRSVRPQVQTIVANYQAAEAQRRASVALNNNNREEAERQYEFADEVLSGALLHDTGNIQAEQQLQAVRRNRTSASRAATPAAARNVALESYDDAMAAEGF